MNGTGYSWFLDEEGKDLEGGEQQLVVIVAILVVVVMDVMLAIAEIDLGAGRSNVPSDAANVRRLQPRWAGKVDAPSHGSKEDAAREN